MRDRYLIGFGFVLALLLYAGLLIWSNARTEAALPILDGTELPAQEMPVGLPGDPWVQCGFIRQDIKRRLDDPDAVVTEWGERILSRGGALLTFKVKTRGEVQSWSQTVLPNGRAAGLHAIGP